MRWIAILSAFALAACSTVAENSEDAGEHQSEDRERKDDQS